LSFLTWGLFVSQTAQHSRPASRREHLSPALGLEILFCFFLVLKTGGVQFGVERVALKEDSRIFWGIFWYSIIIIIIIIIISLPYPVVVN
jgi:hypothetical protein